MTQPHDRDVVVDRLLAVAPRHEGAPTEHCLDADTLGALAEGGLSSTERAACMDHVASCPHCQTVLAAVIRTTPEGAPSRAWWQLRPWPWLVPALGGALALLVWTAVDRRPAVVVISSAPQVAEPTQIAAAGERAATPPLDPLARKELERQSNLQGASRQAVPPASSAPAADALAQAKPRGTPQDAVSSELKARADAAPLASAIENAAIPAPPPPAQLADATARSAQPFAAGGALNPRAGGAAVAPPAPKEVAPVAQRAELGQSAAAAAPVAADTLRRLTDAAAPIEVRSSDPRIRWRIIGNGVERSADGGATWTAQAVGASTRLTAGSAPLPEVCWIVGEVGTVVVTADGLSWTRLAFPVQVPLVSVNATSADAASVTTSDGRVFTTTDRGRTWK